MAQQLKRKFSPEEVGRLKRRVGSKASTSEFRQGLKVEREHADVLKGNETSLARVAAAHLKEKSDYYTRLKKVEGE